MFARPHRQSLPCLGSSLPRPAQTAIPAWTPHGLNAGYHRRARGREAGSARPSLPRACALWTPEDHHLPRRTEVERSDRPHGARRRHASGRLPRLRRQGAGANAQARRHRGDGQPSRPPQRRRPRGHSPGRGRAPLPAALQPRSQPDRDGLLQVQGRPQAPRRPHRHRTLGGHRPRHRHLHAGRVPKLLRRCRIRPCRSGTCSRWPGASAKGRLLRAADRLCPRAVRMEAAAGAAGRRRRRPIGAASPLTRCTSS